LPVRVLFFDKTQQTNWLVPWHQDLTIAVAGRVDVDSFFPWSVKEGVVHVQPPVALLNRMVTVRLHLDDCDASSGALNVIPNTHFSGKLSPAEIERYRSRGPIVSCAAKHGDALLMCPLLLHASSPAKNPRHRRVLHVEFASESLPGGLAWYEQSKEPADVL
jgi:ectoine hydroxylase-related dioxygenase (phytanoyl-CoA dioxygenase family)